MNNNNEKTLCLTINYISRPHCHYNVELVSLKLFSNYLSITNRFYHVSYVLSQLFLSTNSDKQPKQTNLVNNIRTVQLQRLACKVTG